MYDLQDDPHEWTNQAGNPQFSAIRNRLGMSGTVVMDVTVNRFIPLHGR